MPTSLSTQEGEEVQIPKTGVSGPAVRAVDQQSGRTGGGRSPAAGGQHDESDQDDRHRDAGVCATGLTACGDDAADEPFKGQKADAIAAKAVKATNAASSVHIAGTAQQQGGNTIKVDFKVDTEDNCTGTLSGQGAEADVIKTHETGYVKGNQAFWKNALKNQPGSDKLIGELQGNWVKTPTDDTSTQDICDKQAVLAAMDRDKSERKGMTKGEITTVNGEEAIVLKKKDGGETLSLYVATEGKPYLLKATSTGGASPSTMNFTDYNETVKATPPPADEVVDAKKLAAKGN